MARKTIMICDWCGFEKAVASYDRSFCDVNYWAKRRPENDFKNKEMEVCEKCAEGFETVIERFIEARTQRKLIKQSLGNDASQETAGQLQDEINRMNGLINQLASENAKATIAVATAVSKPGLLARFTGRHGAKIT